MQPQQPKSNQSPAKKGYGKRSVGQWVLIYVVVAVVVYAVAFVVYRHYHKSSPSSSGGTGSSGLY